MPPQNMQIGNRIFSHISFVTPVRRRGTFPGSMQMDCCQPCSSSESLSATGTVTSSSIPGGAGEA